METVGNMLNCIGDKRRLEILRRLATKPSYGLELGKNEVTQNLEYVYVAEQDGTLYFSVVEMLYNGNPVTESVLGSSVQMTINGSSISTFNKSYEVQTGDELALIVKDYSWDGSGVVSANINLRFEAVDPADALVTISHDQRNNENAPCAEHEWSAWSENALAQMERTCVRCGEIQVNPFVDVPVDSFYLDSVLWAVENGITNGTSSVTFSPSAACVRAQIVTFLYRTYA